MCLKYGLLPDYRPVHVRWPWGHNYETIVTEDVIDGKIFTLDPNTQEKIYKKEKMTRFDHQAINQRTVDERCAKLIYGIIALSALALVIGAGHYFFKHYKITITKK
jgi:hypothetical protein